MRVLVINCGSATFKFACIDTTADHTTTQPEQPYARGVVERIGRQATVKFTAGTDVYDDTATIADHAAAIQCILDWLGAHGHLGPDGVEAVGHRVVHGGDRFVAPVRLDDEVIAALDALSDLAPLHNAPALSAIRATREELGASVPMVATFDTAFHHTLPARASQYAIPQDLARRYHIRRYGFHGIAHRYMSERYAALTSTPINRLRLITLQLGSGCSAAAIEAGRSVDTSMGLTPLEGLMMGTRCGDVDPTLPGFLARHQGIAPAEVEQCLNTRSGLLGVSGRSSDMRELLTAADQRDAQAALAIDMFCYRVRKCIGAYIAVLNGADAVIFGGGIGENTPEVRQRICAGMDWCGLTLDTARNAATVGSEARISTDNAGIQAYVIPVNEAVIIARDTAECLHST
jgi:acetate kinase